MLRRAFTISSPRRLHLIAMRSLAFVMGFFALLPLAAPQPVTSPNERANERVVLFLGDSLTEGYGVKKEEAYPELVRDLLEKSGTKIKVVNGSISGSVSADADRRLRWFLKTKPEIMVLALGSNDALKGTSPKVIKENLAKVIDLAQTNGITVLLCGVRVFTNFGADYTRSLEQVYKDLAKEKKLEFMPFLLEGVALDRELNQSDGRHPNAKGHAIIAKNVAKELEPILKKTATKPAKNTETKTQG